MQIPNAGFITISEYTWNRPKSIILPGGSTKQFEYDPLMRVKSITAKDPGQNVLLNYQYSHDKMDNITSKVTGHGNNDYDDLYRLADVDNPDFDDGAFTYDGVGNRLTSEGVTGNWSYNTNNELTGYDDVSYVYDTNGNTTNKTNGTNETKYIYNTEDRLSEVRDGSDALIASYYYDPFGRRLWKEVSGTRTYCHYADEGLIGEYDSTGAEIKTYGYKPGSTWTTDPLFMKVGSEYYFYQNDHLGTPQKMTSVNGAVVWSAKYSSFGEATVDAASTVTNNLRFPGQYYDAETGLHYNRFRFYDYKLGRYLRTDLVNFSDTGKNIYKYSRNNSINRYDPYGLFSLGNPLGWATNDSLCKEWVEREKKNLKWLDDLPDCPCEVKINPNSTPCLPEYTDGSKWEKVTNAPPSHPGGKWEIRSKAVKGHGQQCVYNKKGKLMTTGAAAGTPDKAASQYKIKHFDEDLLPWMWCGGDQNAYKMYNERVNWSA